MTAVPCRPPYSTYNEWNPADASFNGTVLEFNGDAVELRFWLDVSNKKRHTGLEIYMGGQT